MANARHFNYKGWSITTRSSACAESEGRPKMFLASFTVKSKVDGLVSWQEFLSASFTDEATATANALTAAMKSIDDSLAKT